MSSGDLWGAEGNVAGMGTHAGNLLRDFVVPPFSVLDTKAGYWQERKRAWLHLGIESELGRGRDLLTAEGMASWDTAQFDPEAANSSAWRGPSGSIFDPVLCEVVYRWFAPPGGEVLDPFAGGSVRGVVAHKLGLQYLGVELSEAQVTANEVQGDLLVPGNTPIWLQGDSRSLLDGNDEKTPDIDLIFTCPPYFDLEVYSDDPADLSAMSWEAFEMAYMDIIWRALTYLSPNRFSVWVVSNVRDKVTGMYRDLCGLTIRAHSQVGMGLYNEAILLNSIGSLPVRVNKTMASSRKLGRAHQCVLVFLKGSAQAFASEAGLVEANWVGWDGSDPHQTEHAL